MNSDGTIGIMHGEGVPARPCLISLFKGDFRSGIPARLTVSEPLFWLAVRVDVGFANQHLPLKRAGNIAIPPNTSHSAREHATTTTIGRDKSPCNTMPLFSL